MDLTALSCISLWPTDGPFHLQPPFRQPYLSTSLSDFWGRRWNRPQSQLLRILVFEPVREGRLVRPLTQSKGVVEDGVHGEAVEGGAQQHQQQQVAWRLGQGHGPKDYSAGALSGRSSFSSEGLSISSNSRSSWSSCSSLTTSNGSGSSSCVQAKGLAPEWDGPEAASAPPSPPRSDISSLASGHDGHSMEQEAAGRAAAQQQGPRDVRGLLALLATFAFSGLEHLLFFW